MLCLMANNDTIASTKGDPCNLHVKHVPYMLPIRPRPDNLHRTKQLSIYIVLVETLSADVHATNDNFD